MYFSGQDWSLILQIILIAGWGMTNNYSMTSGYNIMTKMGAGCSYRIFQLFRACSNYKCKESILIRTLRLCRAHGNLV